MAQVKDSERAGPSSVKIVKHRSVPDIVKTFAEMVAALPTGDDETSAMQIAGRLLDAESPEQLNVISELPSGEDVAGKVLIVTGITRRPSDYEGPLGIYLVIEAADASTGEQVRFGCGATGVVAALAKAYSKGWLPLRCEITKATKATKSGYYPLNLRVYGGPGSF